MRELFRQYFRPTDSEFAELWEHCLFSFDASVLLNVYGYSSETREELVNFLEKNLDRLRLPHQFGLEYCRDRARVIAKQVNNYQRVENDLNRIRKEHIVPKRDHPYLSNRCLKAYDRIQKELEESRKAMEKLISSDPYLERILKVFEGRVGDEPSSEALAQLHTEAKERYEKRIPPGFADLKEKEPPDAYGDYIAWRQLMQIAAKEQTGIILVIDDLKDDWWQIEKERTVGPSPELLEEFSRVSHQQIHFYNSENFLRAAKRFTAAEIGENAIQEVTERLASQRQTRRTIEIKLAVPKDLSPSPEKAVTAGDKLSDGPKPAATAPQPSEMDKLRTETE